MLASPDAYNRMFTIHGVVMIFFFLVPSIPAVLGNFFMPLMIGARDLAFPRLNLLSWYLYMIGGSIALWILIFGGRRHRLDVLHAVSARCSRTRSSCRRRWRCSSRGSRRS